MKRFSKLVFALVLTLATSLLTVVTVSAETEAPTLSIEDIVFTFNYTSDSAVKDGIKTQIYTDPISNQTGIEIVPDFGIGYELFDNPDTEIIDGIRINGAEVTSLRIPVDAENTITSYDISIRTVYKADASGDIAQILDGTYDYSKLITNPIIIFQLVYWSFMAVSGIVGVFTAANSKKKKVKTADEIAAAVTNSLECTKSDLLEYVTDVVKAEILPLAQASVKSGKEAVKAMLISNLKSKDAPSAMLDIFKESEDVDISNLVDEAREEFAKMRKTEESTHAANAATLHQIATNVIQEDVSNEKDTDKVHKSIF